MGEGNTLYILIILSKLRNMCGIHAVQWLSDVHKPHLLRAIHALYLLSNVQITGE